MRSPDAAWVLQLRPAALSPEQIEQLIPLCPDFVLELRSPSDHLSELRAKLSECLANRSRRGWLLDPEPRHVYVYPLGQAVELLENPETVSAHAVLPGFALDLPEIW